MQETKQKPPGDARKESRDTRRRPYAKPRLEAYGDVRDFTLGSPNGVGDSGNFNTEKIPGP